MQHFLEVLLRVTEFGWRDGQVVLVVGRSVGFGTGPAEQGEAVQDGAAVVLICGRTVLENFYAP